MNKFKVGQKVRVKRNIKFGSKSSNDIYFNEKMEKYTGNVVTIDETNVFGDSYRYYIKEDDGSWHWDEEWFEPVEVVKSKEDLKDLDIVTLANGDRLYFFKGEFNDLNAGQSNNVCDLDDLNDDLTFVRDYNEENNVIKVERPVSYYEVFNREESVIEMTVEEISKALGYEVKIVKEK